jgi:hypothetical protein
VIADDAAGPREPEGRQLVEDAALVGNAGTEHVIEGGNPVRRYEDQVIARSVDVADLAAAHQGQAVEFRI